MTANALMTSISGDTEVAGTLEIAAPAALLRGRFFHTETKKPEPDLLPPFGRETALRGKTVDEDGRRRDDHRPDGSTYPQEISVLTSGATPLSKASLSGTY